MNTPDLRLLQVFEAIHKTRSVSRAADALELGQPAVSIALGKLREHFSDPLFVRTSGGMEPTPLAEELLQPIRKALDALEAAFGHRSVFDPATSIRRFRIAMTDITHLVLLPRLWRALRAVAPGVRIDIAPLGDDTGRELESGEADLAVGFIPALEAGFYQQALFRQNYVCLASADHPRIHGGLTRAQFEAEDHAVFRATGTGHHVIEQEIARLGIERRIVLDIPNFLGAAFIVEHTDLLMTVPRRLGELLRGRGEFSVLPVPFPLPEYTVKQHWHARFHHDPGNRWLRGVIAGLVSESTN
ncbi:MAG TPA: LysR family transcriptional regulator [Thauera phenylacetica]|jgi:DNA-binding transcriptional LysR family regulator|uniref:Putative LysR-type transcriptional regulator NahR n=1 Tax=Thauera phenylacetica B4P TaxID=1234382 RepID=N7A212_9RHOO|nr:LysR family transcriptional regulator [Thauera phenylacetica]ENO98339.1 putative LysR-type transcriptional regulator NahR [Thauera phenylacetica B4P]MBP7639903.1 LysR family transcriptional regulator [Thauera sp.]HRM68260.1 LysR family transcriptional regulator [Thauera phenylacetica]